MTIGRPPVPEHIRFDGHVNRDGPIPAYRPELGPCHLWTSGVNKAGYPNFTRADRTTVGAHRFALLLAGETIPPGYQVDHLCRVPRCVRRSHLEAVPPAVNQQREKEANGRTGGEFQSARTHCPSRHEYDEANTRVYRGHRYCRQCMRDVDSRRPNAWQRRKAKLAVVRSTT